MLALGQLTAHFQSDLPQMMWANAMGHRTHTCAKLIWFAPSAYSNGYRHFHLARGHGFCLTGQSYGKFKNSRNEFCGVVPTTGLEPVRCYSLEPESSASANSATRALLKIGLRICWNQREGQADLLKSRNPQRKLCNRVCEIAFNECSTYFLLNCEPKKNPHHRPPG